MCMGKSRGLSRKHLLLLVFLVFKKICAILPAEIRPQIEGSYHYGKRQLYSMCIYSIYIGLYAFGYTSDIHHTYNRRITDKTYSFLSAAMCEHLEIYTLVYN